MKYTLPLLVAALALTLGSCKKDKDDPEPTPIAQETARLMLFNGCVASGNLSVRLNDTAIPDAGTVAFPGRSGYWSVGPGAGQKVSFLLENSMVPLISQNLNMNVDGSYTVFVGGMITDPVILSSADDLSNPGTGQARVRFVNLSPDNLNESAFVGSQHIGSDVGTGEMSPFVVIPAGTATVIAQDPSNIPMSRNLEHNFVEGRVYSIVLTGTGSGVDNAALRLSVLQHN